MGKNKHQLVEGVDVVWFESRPCKLLVRADPRGHMPTQAVNQPFPPRVWISHSRVGIVVGEPSAHAPADAEHFHEGHNHLSGISAQCAGVCEGNNSPYNVDGDWET